MDSVNKISDAGLYTNFSGLAELKAEAARNSDGAAKEVAKQFESVFLQMMLKSMRDASVPGSSASAESDQTRFYQDMFDKQIALELSNQNNGTGIGLAAMLEKEITGDQISTHAVETDVELIQKQVRRSTSTIHRQQGNGQE